MAFVKHAKCNRERQREAAIAAEAGQETKSFHNSRNIAEQQNTHTHIGMGESGESIAQRIEERKVPIVAADAVALILRRRQNSNKQQQMQTASKPLTEKPPPNPSPKLQHPFNHPTAAPPIHPLNPTKHKQTRENRAKQCN